MVNKGAALLLVWLYAVASFIHHPSVFTASSRRHSRTVHHASMSTMSLDELPVEILQALTVYERGPQGVAIVLRELLHACRIIGTALRDGEYTSSLTGTENAFGDKQLDIDIQADKVLFDCLTRSGVVHVAASEENPTEIDCGYRHDIGSTGSSNDIGSDSSSSSGISKHGRGFSVAFDPLDGSSVVDANFAVGTIAGIWPGNGLLGRLGREQTASLMCVYGPRVTMALALNGHATASGEATSVELTMEKSRWVVTNKRFVGKATKQYHCNIVPLQCTVPLLWSGSMVVRWYSTHRDVE